eukprot:TRINITY_DN2469_c0_g1_i1.p1 TRINITY_DN2469_c0_g1~~TRINITY_DN2469_c0_g1_i1.p1  ORF type:complete len:227 (-),score=32.26 TRINITY_DN2469_c0_g1_i1:37-717(-)
MTEEKETLNIIAYGASLTAGYLDGTKETPFTSYLQTLLTTRFSHLHFTIENCGLPGFTSEEIKQAITTTHHGHTKIPYLEQHTFHIVTLLAGTNDLGRNYETPRIVESLQSLYDCILSSDSDLVLIVMSIPESCNGDAVYCEKRGVVNESIREYADERDRVDFVDLCASVPFSGDSYYPYDRDAMWMYDGLHFSPNGYQRMAQLIYTQVENIIQHKYSNKQDTDIV